MTDQLHFIAENNNQVNGFFCNFKHCITVKTGNLHINHKPLLL